jgi:hypothetical protein
MHKGFVPVFVATLTLWGLPARAQVAPPPPEPAAMLARFLALWSGKGPVPAGAVAALYAPEVIYYGHRRTQAEVLAEKQALARRFPLRRYRLLPNSAAERCEPGGAACTVTGVLDWEAGARGRGTRGGATIRLDLAAVGGRWKIVRESGATIARARCSASACSGWHVPALPRR